LRQQNRPVVLIRGGIGITPLLTMLNGIAAAESPREVWLLYGVRDDGDHIMRAPLVERPQTNISSPL
jgi:nitric oxide dioxygenase